MISTKFIQSLLNTYNITQKDLSSEWSKYSGKNKSPSNLSRALNSTHVDSASLIKALSKLTNIPAGDILYEVAASKDNLVFNSVSEPTSGYIEKDAQVDIPVSDLGSMAGGLLGAVNELTVPRAWVKYGAHKVCPIYDEGMIPSIMPGDLLVFRLVDPGEWDDIDSSGIFQIINTDGNQLVRRIDSVSKTYVNISSENPNKSLYPDYNLDRANVSQIWEAEFKITWKFPKTGDAITDQQSIAKMLNQLSNEMKEIKKRVPK